MTILDAVDAAEPATQVTPEDLLNLPDAVRYELVDGQLVERNMGMESSEVAVRIVLLIGMFLHAKRLGHLFGADASYKCFPHDPKMLRRADVSFIRAGRLPGDQVPKGYCPIAPDLAVEVVSPGDTAYEVEEKVAEYLAAGVPLIWVVYPTTRTLRIHRPRSAARGPVSALSDADTITGEDVIDGFTASVRAFFE